MDGSEVWLAAVTAAGAVLTSVVGGIGYVGKRLWDRIDKRFDEMEVKLEECEKERTQIDHKADELLLTNQSLLAEIRECVKDRAELREIIDSHREELNRVNKHLEFTDKKVEKVIEVLPDVK